MSKLPTTGAEAQAGGRSMNRLSTGYPQPDTDKCQLHPLGARRMRNGVPEVYIKRVAAPPVGPQPAPVHEQGQGGKEQP